MENTNFDDHLKSFEQLLKEYTKTSRFDSNLPGKIMKLPSFSLVLRDYSRSPTKSYRFLCQNIKSPHKTTKLIAFVIFRTLFNEQFLDIWQKRDKTEVRSSFGVCSTDYPIYLVLKFPEPGIFENFSILK